MESFESEGSTFHFEAGGTGRNKTPGQSGTAAPAMRPAYRPPLGVPVRKNRELGGKIAAIAVHLFFLLLLLAPLTSPELRKEILGAGGLSAPGGGGGGSRGSGGGSHVQERTQYVKVTPPTPTPTPTPVPQVVPPVVPPPVKPPEIKPPVETPKPPAPVETKVETKIEAPPSTAASVTAGVGGGAGNDGTAGSGVGSGGGVGSGVGTGRGSGTGPGTGSNGATGTVYPPTPTELFIPPMPPPSKIKGFELIAQFDVDSTGKVIDFEFTQTKDGAYNKKLKEILASVRFRPGVNERGIPVRAKTQIVYTF